MTSVEVIVLVAAIILVIVIVFAVIAGITIFWLKRMAARHEAVMRERFPSAEAVISGANFFGQESKGAMQLRGNGTLVLTDKEIVFERWVARAEYRIPLADIQTVELVSWHLGKSVGRPLVRVVYQGLTGDADSMAWYVKDAESVKQRIEHLRA